LVVEYGKGSRAGGRPFMVKMRCTLVNGHLPTFQKPAIRDVLGWHRPSRYWLTAIQLVSDRKINEYGDVVTQTIELWVLLDGAERRTRWAWPETLTLRVGSFDDYD